MLKSKKFLAYFLILSFLISTIPALPSAALEIESSYSINVNTPITDNLSERGTINWYSFTLSHNGKVSVTFAHEELKKSNELWEINIYNSAEDELVHFNSRGNETSITTQNMYLSAGTYYIRVRIPGYSWYSAHDTASYIITVNYEENTGQYEIELNDSRETATVLYAESPIIGNLGVRADIDWYSFTLPNNGKMSVTFEHTNLENSSEFWEIHVFNEMEEELVSFKSRGKETSLTSQNMYLSAGTYHIRVRIPGYSWYSSHNIADYTITANYEENIGQYEVEPNDSKETATKAYPNFPVTGNLRVRADMDWYVFNVSDDSDFTVTMTHENLEDSKEFWEVHVFNAAEEEIARFRSRGKEPTITSKNMNLSAGTYYVRVRIPDYSWYSSHNIADYTIIVNDLSDTSTPSSWAQDDINRARRLGLLPPSLDGKYQNNITRAEFCELAVRVYEKNGGTYPLDFYIEPSVFDKQSPFNDTSIVDTPNFTDIQHLNDDMQLSIQKMVSIGVVKGVGNDRFNPDGDITRQESAVMLNRLIYALNWEIPLQEMPFSDINIVADWAKMGVSNLSLVKIMNGIGDNKFDPFGKYTREQSIATFIRMWKLVNHEDYSMIQNGCYDGVYTYVAREDLEIFVDVVEGRVRNHANNLVVNEAITANDELTFGALLFTNVTAAAISGIAAGTVVIPGVGTVSGAAAGAVGAVILTAIEYVIDEVSSYVEIALITKEALHILGIDNILEESSATLFRFKGKTLNSKSKIEPCPI